MTRQSVRRLSGIVMTAAASAACAQTLQPILVDGGLFRYEAYQLPPGSGPTFLLEGPDGDLWFSKRREGWTHYDIRRTH